VEREQLPAVQVALEEQELLDMLVVEHLVLEDMLVDQGEVERLDQLEEVNQLDHVLVVETQKVVLVAVELVMEAQ
jgi:hypothetical protein